MADGEHFETSANQRDTVAAKIFLRNKSVPKMARYPQKVISSADHAHKCKFCKVTSPLVKNFLHLREKLHIYFLHMTYVTGHSSYIYFLAPSHKQPFSKMAGLKAYGHNNL